jgi:hypothetical protein
MCAEFATPELRITYSPLFSFEIKLDKAERVASMGYVSWRFSVRCTVCHSKGQFTYEADDSYLEATALERFAQQLDAMRAGRGEHAELTDDSPAFQTARLTSKSFLPAALCQISYRYGSLGPLRKCP